MQTRTQPLEAMFIEPYSAEAEEAVIGCVLIDPDLFGTLSPILGTADFYIHRLAFVWRAFAALAERGIDIDILTVTQELERAKCLDEVGGSGYLTELIGLVPTTLHATSYAETVKNFAGKREFLRMANKVATFSMNGKSVAEIAAYVEKETGRIAIAGGIETSSILDSYEAVRLGMQATEDAAGGKKNVVPTGLADLDKLTRGGFREGRLILIAGRPGDGKSSLLLTIAGNAAALGKRVGMFSMEMPTEEQVNRLIAQVSGIDCSRIESGEVIDDEWPQYYAAVGRVQKLPIYWDDTPSLTIPQLRTKARKMAEMGVDLLLVDSLNLINPQMPGSKAYETINAMGYQLKILSRELRVPLVAAHHMSRSIEQVGREPQMSDLEQAGEKPADIIAFIYRSKDPDRANVSHLKIAKYRGGPLGKIDLIFRANVTKFENAVSHNINIDHYEHRENHYE